MIRNRGLLYAVGLAISVGMLLVGALTPFYPAIIVGAVGIIVVAGVRVADRRQTKARARQERSEVDLRLLRVLIGAVCIAIAGIGAGTAVLVVWGAKGAASGVGAYLGSGVLLWWSALSFRRWRGRRLPAQRNHPNA